MKESKIKEIEKSSLQVRKVVKRWRDDLGREWIDTAWFDCDIDINLGSLAKPNKEVLTFKYNIPAERRLLE